MDTTATRQIWKHRTSGDLYAVELGEGDIVSMAYGPLTGQQAKQIANGARPDDLGLSSDGTEFVQNKTDDFEPFQPT